MRRPTHGLHTWSGRLAPLAAEPGPVPLCAEADAAGGDWSGPFLLLRRFMM